MVSAFIDTHKDAFGVEPICAVLGEHGITIAPSTYYARKTRTPSARTVRDAGLSEEIWRVFHERELDGLTLIQGPITFTLNGTKVNEHITLVRFGGDKAEALRIVEPLDGAHDTVTHLPTLVARSTRLSIDA